MCTKTLMTLMLAVALSGCSSDPADDNHGHGDTHGEPNHHHNAADTGHDDDAQSPDVGASDTGVVTSAAARTYCECVFVACHDPFHEKFGADDVASIAACEAEASALPVAGSEQMSGNSIECRQYQCENIGADVSCADALGAACT